MSRPPVLLLALLLAVLASACGSNQLILATTTSTQDSGLLDVLVPAFEKESGYRVKTIAVGSGQALRLGEEGEADVILAHSPAAEEKFMADGYGSERRLVMHNDFVIVGPQSDPAGLGAATSSADAFARIADSHSLFLSRGDESGTHTKELGLWEKAEREPSGSWYQETGQGMGATLQVAGEKSGYTLSDRGTFLAQRASLDLAIVFEGDPQLFNVYHVIVVNPEKHPQVNNEGARAFARFITSSPIQDVVRSFGVDLYGEPLFVPDAFLEATQTPPAQP
ncbi:MAG: substrate-binding domain-containing protein [Dehalococcoidia bacterium]|nr:substrate-binding domain-containing protein [Dehalococcoidia bacterium]